MTAVMPYSPNTWSKYPVIVATSDAIAYNQKCNGVGHSCYAEGGHGEGQDDQPARSGLTGMMGGELGEGGIRNISLPRQLDNPSDKGS